MTTAQPDAWPAIVLHADMDAFYASVEQLDHPELRGKPVLVGPNSNRGVVLTASYEARPYRVGSAMPVAEARRRCPDAVMVPPRFERYQALSQKVMSVFADFSPKVEAISLDEAFIDMSGASHIFGPPDAMARKLQRAVFEATGGLTISVGASATKYVAKVASGFKKPNGITIVPPEHVRAWLAPQDVARLWGAGAKTQARLRTLGYQTIADVAAASEETLTQQLGAIGGHFYALAHGCDPRRVVQGRAAKSMSSDRTLMENVSDRAQIARHLQRSADRLGTRLRAKGLRAGGVRVKLKTTQFETLSRQCVVLPTQQTADLTQAAVKLLGSFNHPGPFRLVGLAVFDLQSNEAPRSGDLFSDHSNRRLDAVIDAVNEKFGDRAVRRARDIGRETLADHTVNLDFVEFSEDG